MFVAAYITHVFASVNITEMLIWKNLLRYYSDIVNFLLNRFSNDQAIGKLDSKFFCYIQLAHMTPMQYTDELYAQSYKVADVYDKSAHNSILIND